MKRIFCAIMLMSICALPIFSQIYPRQPKENIYIEESDAKIYFKRAAEYENNRQWREAIEQYIAALKKYPDAVYQIDTNRYAGIKYYFYQQLLKYPDELLSYRQMYNAISEALFEKAIAENDEQILKRIVDEMFFALYGDESANALAESLTEKGRIGEALLYWDMIVTLYPDTNLPKELIYFKIARASKLIGNNKKYQETLRRLQTDYPDKVIYVRGMTYQLTEAIKILEEIFFPASNIPANALSWTNWGGNPEHNLITDADAKNDIRLWSLGLESNALHPQAKPATTSYPWWYPILIDNMIYVNTGLSVMAYEVRTAKMKGVYPLTPEMKTLPLTYLQQGRQGLPYNSQVFSCAFDDRRVYANLLDVNHAIINPRNNYNQYLAYLVAVDTPTFKIAWDTHLLNDELVNEINVFSPPIVHSNHVYAAGVKESGMESLVYLFCFDATNGKLCWKRFICSKISGTHFNMPYYFSSNMPTIAESNGIILCLTNAGILAAISADKGDIIWLVNYTEDISTQQTASSRIISYPVIHNNVGYVTPLDTKRIYGFDIYTGTFVGGSAKIFDAGEGNCILGVTDDFLVTMNSKNEIYLFDIRKNIKLSMGPIHIGEPPVGRPFISKNYLYLPMNKKLLRLDMVIKPPKVLPSARLVDETEWVDEDDAGNLIVIGPYLLMASDRHLSLHIDQKVFAREFDQKLETQSDSFDMISNYVKTMIDNRQYAEAIKRLHQVLSIIETAKPELKGGKLDRETRDQLGLLYYLLGGVVSKENNNVEGVSCYRKALDYVNKKSLLAQLLLSLAGSLDGTEAVGFYQRAITECPDEYYEINIPELPKNRRVQVRHYAAQQITLIIKKQPQAYQSVQLQANQSFGKLNQRNQQELIDFLNNYPNAQQINQVLIKLSEMAKRENELYSEAYYLRKSISDSIDQADVTTASEKLCELYQKRQLLYQLQHLLKYLSVKWPETPVNINGRKMNAIDYVNKYFNELQAKIWQSIPPFKSPLSSEPLYKFTESVSAKYITAWDGPSLFLNPLPILPEFASNGVDEDKIGLLSESNSNLFYLQAVGVIEAWDIDKKKINWVNYDIFNRLSTSFTDLPIQINQLPSHSPLDRAGCKVNDVIKSIDAKPVQTVSELINIMNDALTQKKTEMKLLIMRPDSSKPELSESIIINIRSEYFSITTPFDITYRLAPGGDLIVNSSNSIQRIDGATGQIKWIRCYNDGKITNILPGLERIYVTLAEDKPDPKKPDKLPHYINRLVCCSMVNGVTLWETEGKENDAEPISLGGNESILVRRFEKQIEIIDTNNGEIIKRDDILGGLQPGLFESRSSATTFNKVYYLKNDNNLISHNIYKYAVEDVIPLKPGQPLMSRWLSASENFACLSFSNSIQLFNIKEAKSELITQRLGKLIIDSPQEYHVKSISHNDFIYLWNTSSKKVGYPRDLIMYAIDPLQDGTKQVKWISSFPESNMIDLIPVTEREIIVVTRLNSTNKIKVIVLDKKGGRIAWEKEFIPQLIPSQKPVGVFNGKLVISAEDGLYIY